MRRPEAALKVFEFIKTYKQDHDGNSPTYQIIGENCGMAKKSAWDHVQRLWRWNVLGFDEAGGFVIDGEYNPPEDNPRDRMRPPRKQNRYRFMERDLS